MGAPKRSKASLSILTEIESRKEWLAAFRRNVSQEKTARRAWEILERAGLEETARVMLWRYTNPSAAYIEKELGKVREVNRKVKALILADKVALQKTGDRRSALFIDRAMQKYKDVALSEMPLAGDGVTVGKWALSRVAAGKGVPVLAASRKAFASLGPRSPLTNRKFWLFVLLGYAKNAGVRLGLERLTALAHCADPDCGLEPRTLARFLASLPADFKAKCLNDFRILPLPSLFLPQD